MAVSCTAPISAAFADEATNGEAAVDVVNVGGVSVDLTGKVTLPQLASLLKVSEPELVSKIEALPGESTIGSLLSGLLANPTATVEELLGGLTANDLNPGIVEQLLNTLLGPELNNAGQLQGVVETLLSDLGIDGQLGSLASQLGVPVELLEHIGLIPLNAESLANALGTTVEHLGSLLGGVGALTQPINIETPLVVAPIGGETVRETSTLVGSSNGGGGVSLTRLTAVPGPAGPAGTPGVSAVVPAPVAAPASSPVSNAFSIVSVKLTKAGLIQETVKLPSAGKLSVSGSAKGTTASVARSGKTKKSVKAIKVAPLSTSTAAGTKTITLHPSKLAKTAQHIVVSLTTTYTPTGGAASAKHSSVTFKGNAQKKAKHKG